VPLPDQPFFSGPGATCWPSIIRGADSVASSRAGRCDYARKQWVAPLIIHATTKYEIRMTRPTATAVHTTSLKTLHVLLRRALSLPFLISGPASRSNASFSRKDLLRKRMLATTYAKIPSIKSAGFLLNLLHVAHLRGIGLLQCYYSYSSSGSRWASIGFWLRWWHATR